ncbi:4'-phosphopantetheinyl transferase superfamily protein [Alkalinema sp. FACHB-956]|uniref:4'-phosphopantetheinyl transferase family protein n=1 Tax=Alkalinema sp. FACHB-956 TaxID=2692768 RepID=UPI0016847B95|nr:4'-phosphopantetheinyl transferase superfamily protein [Alkalinema sp. FACHB-956]MBD2326837.1 4'-phosphopantetheinyl transferase superfamily protein [Alkalinema sp. FACHB-956]
MATVHLWQAGLDCDRRQLAHYAQRLSPDEQQRADRFVKPRHRDRFITGRGILRGLLGQCLGIAPERLQFSYGAHGKPDLAYPANSGWQFNLAHSEDQSLIALTQGAAIGVDLEKIRPMPQLEQLTARFYAPDEHAQILAAPIADREMLFFRYWTCKEAFLKATGEGLGKLQHLQLALGRSAQEEPVRIITLPESPPTAWQLRELPLTNGFVGAIAVAHAEVAISFTSFQTGEFLC